MKFFDKKWKVGVVAGVSVVVLVLAAFFIIKNIAYQTYLAGAEAHRKLDASTAIEQYEEVLAYPMFLGDFMADAAVKLEEAQAYENANTLWANGQYAEAQAAFSAFLQGYRRSVFEEESQQALLDIPFEWVQSLLDEADYEGAADVYEAIIGDENQPDEAIEEAKEGYFDACATWADSEFQAGNYSKAETILTDLVSWSAKTNPSRKTEAETDLGEMYMDWGDLLYGDQDYEEAIAKYELATEQDGSALINKAEENIGSCYLDWGDELVQAGNLGAAGEKYGALVLNYADSDAARQLTNQASEPLILYGEALLDDSEFLDAGVIFTIAYAFIEDGQDELKAAATYGLGRAFHGGKSYFQAITLFDKALTFTQDVTLQESISQAKQASIEGIGQLTDSMGKTIIFVVANGIVRIKTDEPNCYTIGGSETCLTEEELAIAQQVVGQDEDEKRVLLYGKDGDSINLPNDIEAVRPGHFRYVAVLVKSDLQVESCKYSRSGGGYATHYLIRMQRIYKVSLYDTRTGNRIQVGTFYGETPKACPSRYSFGGVTEYYIGAEPELSVVIGWLRQYVE
jgi:tetratricopeptide (TPR) repeat protein